MPCVQSTNMQCCLIVCCAYLSATWAAACPLITACSYSCLASSFSLTYASYTFPSTSLKKKYLPSNLFYFQHGSTGRALSWSSRSTSVTQKGRANFTTVCKPNMKVSWKWTFMQYLFIYICVLFITLPGPQGKAYGTYEGEQVCIQGFDRKTKR